jgi:hypothetical protein
VGAANADSRPPRSSHAVRRLEEEIRTVIRVVRQLFFLSAFALLTLPAAAHASALSDCTRDNDLDHSYSNSELQKALDNLPTDSDEYSNCREVLAGAIHDGSDKGGGRPKNTGPNGEPLSGDEQSKRAHDGQELAALTGKDRQPPRVDVGGQAVQPGDDGIYDLASASNDLPLPLLLALIALGLLALTGALVALRTRIPALARLPLLSKIPTPRVPNPRSSRR